MTDRRESEPIRLKVWAANACFTRPEMKVERVSYDVMTPSAARGVLEAILWKPEMAWRITRIDVLKPVRWESVRRNEVSAVVPTNAVKSAMKSGHGLLGQYIEDSRQQRAGLILKDVAYIIHAVIRLTDKAGPDCTLTKYREMFLRRAQKGQAWHRPYLGCREFAADFALADDVSTPDASLAGEQDLGWMLNDMDYSNDPPEPRFFRASMVNGSIAIPELTRAEVPR